MQKELNFFNSKGAGKSGKVNKDDFYLYNRINSQGISDTILYISWDFAKRNGLEVFTTQEGHEGIYVAIDPEAGVLIGNPHLIEGFNAEKHALFFRKGSSERASFAISRKGLARGLQKTFMLDTDRMRTFFNLTREGSYFGAPRFDINLKK